MRELIEGPQTQQENDLKLSEMILEQGQGWKWEILSFELPPCIKDKIRAILRHQVGKGENIIIWKYSKDGEFTTKSAYALVNGPQEINTPFQRHWIWKTDTLPKIVNFLWLCVHNSVLVKHMLALRGIVLDSSCLLCKSHPEIIGHLLRQFFFAKEFWYKLGVPPAMVDSFTSMDANCWL